MNPKPSSTRILAPAAAAVVLLLTFLFVAAYATTRRAQLETERILTGMVDRSALVARIDSDVDDKQRLVDIHIFETGSATMQDLEERFRAVHDDLTKAIETGEQDYGEDPEMRRALTALRTDLDATSAPLTHVLELSRENRDAEAQLEMLKLVPAFERVNKRLGHVLDVSHKDTVDSAARNSAMQSRTILWLSAIGVIGITLAAIILLVAIRNVHRREEEASQMTLRLEEQNRELDAFAARVAHDLRGPLSTINLAIDRLIERLPDEHATGDILRRGVGRMETLIRDLLTLSRVDSQAPDAASDPAIVAASVVRDLSAPVAEAGGHLELAVDDARVRCSEGLLRDVLWNLVENALKYRGTAPPTIRVEGHYAGNGYEIRVTDNGMGMSADEARHAFDAFFRGARAPRGVSGTGLGLSIVKRIVEVSAGKIAIDSKVDRGTTVIVDLPLARPA
jgi:signal transduction histidine kinase